jgi:protocadherin alpha
VNYAAYGLGAVVISTFLLGMIILCVIKINIMIADKREYAKFEEERKQTEYMINESPLYKSPVTKFENPYRFDPDAFELK